MRNESNWLEYLRKLANEGVGPVATHRQVAQSRSVVRTSSHRDEWLQAGYTAQQAAPSHLHR